MRMRVILAIAAFQMSTVLAQAPPKKPSASNSCDAIINSLAEQAELASSVTLPRAFVPSVLFGIGTAVDGCSFEVAKTLVLRAFEGARTMTAGSFALDGTGDENVASEMSKVTVRDSRRQTLAAILNWLVSSAAEHKQPELVGLARELAGQIDYKEEVIGRQEAFGTIVGALLQSRDDDAVQHLLAEIEDADGASPTALFLAVLESGPSDELKASVLNRGFAAVASGQCGLPADLSYIDHAAELQGRTQAVKALRDCLSRRKNINAPTQKDELATQRAVELLLRLAPELASEYHGAAVKPNAPAPLNTVDPLSKAYEDIQILAEDSSAAVAMRIAQIQDPQTRQALLTSAETALLAAGKTDAAGRIAGVIGSSPVPKSSDQHPMDILMRARSTTAGDDLRSQVSHALAIAEKILLAENREFAAAPSESERIRLYSNSSVEAVTTYLYAAENAFDLAIESAQRIVGPHRAEVLTMVLAAACEKHSRKCSEVNGSN